MAGFAFPSFKYSDINIPDYTYGGDKPKFTQEVDLQAGGQQPGFSFDQALGYGLMQALDPKQRSAARKEELKDLLELQKEQMKQAAPYKMMFELPGQVMQAFAVPAQIRSNILLAGQGAANQILTQGLQSSARNMSNMGFTAPNIQYF